jgi:hypothetical protein
MVMAENLCAKCLHTRNKVAHFPRNMINKGGKLMYSLPEHAPFTRDPRQMRDSPRSRRLAGNPQTRLSA